MEEGKAGYSHKAGREGLTLPGLLVQLSRPVSTEAEKSKVIP